MICPGCAITPCAGRSIVPASASASRVGPSTAPSDRRNENQGVDRMSRRAQAPVRSILPDPKFNNEMLAKFMNVVMKNGKKSAAERIIYGALERIAEKTGKQGGEAIDVLSTALDNVKPVVEVKSRRVGGATYQVPVEVRSTRRQTLARSEEHTSELQSPCNLVCRLLLE